MKVINWVIKKDGAPLQKGKAKRIGIVQPGKKKVLQEDLIVAFWYTKGAYKKHGERLFRRACSDRKGGMASNWKRVGLG